MYSLNKVSIIGIIGACALAASISRAVSPPPDGGYPNQTTAEGEDALFSLTTGIGNTAMGYHALYLNTNTSNNTAIGASALASNMLGYYNTAVGAEALAASGQASNNTAIGYAALSTANRYADTDNVAVGYRAMGSAISYGCVAIGSNALNLNTGQLNVAIGNLTLAVNTTGENNTAIGWHSLPNNQTGNLNTVAGLETMFYNQSGSNNVALGYFALGDNVSGSNNIALGTDAGINTTGSNNIAIGNSGVAEDTGVIRIGTSNTHHATVIAGIFNATLAQGMPVVINREGRLGVTTSSSRFKDEIKPMDHSSESILSLHPVTFRYKHDLDPDGIPQFGLVAEQAEKVNPDLVARDEAGKPYTVRYEAVNAMLLNEFLKEHRKVEEQSAAIKRLESTVSQQETLKSKVAQQQKAIQALTEALRAQAVQIRKVSDQLKAQVAPRVVVKD
jgi:hypothetical protein